MEDLIIHMAFERIVKSLMSVHGTIILQLNAILVLPLKSLKERPERIKLFPSNYVPRTKTKHIYIYICKMAAASERQDSV